MKKLLFLYLVLLIFQNCSNNNAELNKFPINGKIVDNWIYTSDSSFILTVVSNERDSKGFKFNDMLYYQEQDSLPVLLYKRTGRLLWISAFTDNYILFAENGKTTNLILTKNMNLLWSSNDIINGISDNYLSSYDVNGFLVINLENTDTLWKQKDFSFILVTEKQDKVLGKYDYKKLQLRNIKNGELCWEKEIAQIEHKLSDNFLYYYSIGNKLFITDINKLLCLNLDNAEILWETTFDVKPTGTGCVLWSKNYSDSDFIYLKAKNKLYFINNKEQNIQYLCDIKQESLQDPIVVDKYVYFVDDKKVYRYKHNDFSKKEIIFENEAKKENKQTFDCCITTKGWIYQLRNGETYYKSYPD